MADPIAEVLGVNNIVGVIQSIKPGIPAPLPPGYYTVNRTVQGDHVGFDSEAGERGVSTVVDRSSPSRHIVVDGMTQRFARLLTLKEDATVNPNVMQNLRAPGGQVMQRNGMGEVGRIVGRMNKRYENTRTAASHMMLLGGGAIYYNTDGELLPDSTGAINTVDAGIPASNLNQGLQIDGVTAILSANWATNGTDIPGDMESLLTTALERTGYPLTTAIYGKNTLANFLSNDAIKELLKANAPLSAGFSNLAIPAGFLGIDNWVKGAGIFWVDSTGTNRTFVAADEICFLPTPSGDWLENVEGSFMIPNGGPVYGSLLDASNQFAEITGKFGYAVQTYDPPGAKMFTGDSFLPFIKVPNAVYKLDTEFP
jgi:hypothetical protein